MIEKDIEVGYATLNDLSSWMQLIGFVSWNFPGLETEKLINGYRETVIKNINRNSAICAKNNKRVVGILLFSEKHNMLCCMAVHPEYRKKGIATKMIDLMMEALDDNRDVVVTTFRADDEKGNAPRALYKKLGFVEDELCFEFEYPNQKFVLRNKALKIKNSR